MFPIAAFGLFCLTLGAPDLVANGGFEAGSTPIKGVGYVSGGNTLPGWEVLGEAARNPRALAFFDNGAQPDGQFVLALQNRAVLRQDVGPFERDKVYRLRLAANGRATDKDSCGHFGRLQVRLNGTALVAPVEVPAVDAAGTYATPWKAFEVLFVPGDGGYTLELSQVDPGDGISVLIDAVSIEPVDAPAGQAVQINRARARAAGQPVREIDFRRTQWIWSTEKTNPRDAAPVGTRYFRRTFDVADPAQVKRAFFVGSADNQATVWVNGVYRGVASSFGDWYEMDVRESLRPGRNVLAVEALNAGEMPNPAGLAGALVLLGEGDRVLVSALTDARWRVASAEATGWRESGFDDRAWPAAMELGRVGCPPWGTQGFLTWLVPDDFPRFEIPGQERYTELLRSLHWLHYAGSGPKATLWDGWLSMASLWPAVGDQPANDHAATWRAELLKRPIDAEGYVSTIQHHGFGHGEGWPFPTTFQAGGIAWQFATEHLVYRVGATKALDGWALDGLAQTGLDKTTGLTLKIDADTASLTTPAFDVDRLVAPFVRLEWEPKCPAGARATLAWTSPTQPEFGAERSLPLPLATDMPGRSFTHVPLYRHADPAQRLTRLRLAFNGARGGTLRILGLVTACDTRHPVNNPNYVQGCTEYYRWTGDRAFLTENLPRMRHALDFALREFRVEQEGCVFVPWVGHDGRAGYDGKTVHAGLGIGNNYWDLLPFGGHDTLATIYLYDALRRMAQLEGQIAAHPEWRLPPAERGAASLAALADQVRTRSRQRFWNPTTGRFVACIDSAGVGHDYGYTFVNNEAIAFGLASDEQARSILAWLDGQRTVAGDTSTGADIYHWRFGPRATTRRNVDWYTFPWSGPEGIPWGGQVQDGGAVLGFAYHDQTARLRTAGPDSAWQSLRRTLDWFAEVRAEGGYRAYYAKPGRGTLQGGGPAGGLGMDQEFFESALVPQIMLYGFLGFEPTADGFRLAPSLPSDWPSLRVTRIAYRDTVLDITAGPRQLTVACTGGRRQKVRVSLPAGWTGIGADAEIGAGVVLTARRP